MVLLLSVLLFSSLPSLLLLIISAAASFAHRGRECWFQEERPERLSGARALLGSDQSIAARMAPPSG